MVDGERFTVVHYGYLRTAPLAMASHHDHLYRRYPEARCAFSVWEGMWDRPGYDHPKFADRADVKLLPGWVPERLAGWEVHRPDEAGMRAFVAGHGIPEVNCFGQMTWRCASYCTALQNAARFAMGVSDDGWFLFCRPDIRFDGDMHASVPGGLDCASNAGIDYRADGSRRLEQAVVKGLEGRTFLDQMFMVNRRCLERMATLFDEIPAMFRAGVEVNNETLVGWHMHRGGMAWGAVDMAQVSLLRPRFVHDGRLCIAYPVSGPEGAGGAFVTTPS